MLSALHAGVDNTRVVEEMGVWSGSCRIDLAVINGELCGYELKSDSDTLDRLPAQASIYGKVFDRVTLVAGAKHFDRARDLVPEWWGIVIASEENGGVVLRSFRASSRNPFPDPFTIAQLLWRDEAVAILADRGLAQGWRSKTAPAVHQHLAASLSLAELSDAVRAKLKQRTTWLWQPLRD